MWNNETGRVIDAFDLHVPFELARCSEDSTKFGSESLSTEAEISFSAKRDEVTLLQYGNCRQRGRGVLTGIRGNTTDLLVKWTNNHFGVYVQSVDELKGSQMSPLQRLLCQGRSASNVIDELTSHSIPRPFYAPSFTYASKSKRTAYVVVAQRSFPEALSGHQDYSEGWELVQSSLLPFINSLENGNLLSIITFDQTSAEINLPLTELAEDNRVVLHSALPRRPVANKHLSMEACHQCGIDLVQGLDLPPSLDLKVIWIARSGQLPPGSSLPRDTVVIGLHRGLHRSWLGPQTYVLGQCTSSIDCQGEVVSHLMQLGRASGRLVHEESSLRGQTTGSFLIEDDHKEITVVVTATDERDIAWLHLKSPSGRPHVFPIYSHGMALLHLSNHSQLELGLWTYSVQMYDESNVFSLKVFSKSRQSRATFQPFVEAKLDNLGHPRVTMFAASLTKSRVRIDVKISRPSHRGKDLPWVEMALKDTGTGYPDIRPLDGILSAYFTELSPEEGFYHVKMEARLPNGKTLYSLAPSFHVPQLSSSFYVRQEEGSNLLVSDVFPPNRITDLGLVSPPEELLVTLNWTAPGGDYDHTETSAFSYEIRCATSEEALREENYAEQSIAIHSSLIPQPLMAGMQQRSTVGIPWHNQPFYYAVLAIDAAGNRGLISNVISVESLQQHNSSSESSSLFDERLKAQPRQQQPLTGSSSAVIWAPLVALGLLSLMLPLSVYAYKKCALREYVCDEEKLEKASDTTNVSTVSTVSTGSCVDDDELSSYATSCVSSDPVNIHIMEDFCVYRDLSTVSSELPSEYLKLDLMLSALVAAKQRQESLV